MATTLTQLAATINSSASVLTPPQPIPSLVTRRRERKLPLKVTPPKPTNLRESLSALTDDIISTSPASDISLDAAYSLVLDQCVEPSYKSISAGKQIHAHVVKQYHARDLAFLGTKLVLMYGKLGATSHAEEVFDRMRERSVFTYNAMLGAYVANGLACKAIDLYVDMRSDDFVSVDAHTCTCVLKACSELGNLHHGREIHGFALKSGYVCGNNVVGNSLMRLYSSCNDLDSAELLFDTMIERDVVSYNLMISAYAENGMANEALLLFKDMLSSGISPTSYTFVATIQACKDILSGAQIHSLAVKHGFQFDRYISNSLVVMYGSCRSISEAAKVFGLMRDIDNVSWNSMLSAFVQNGLCEESLDFFRKMVSSGKKPDNVSIISALSACGKSRNLMNGKEIHAFALKNGMEDDRQVGNTITDMYAKCSNTLSMEFSFQRIPQVDFVSWTTLIFGYVQNHCFAEALNTFRRITHSEGISIDETMIECVLLACRGLKCISTTKEIHCYLMRRRSFDLVLQNTFVDVYGECGRLDYARNTFSQIQAKNVISWTSMISSLLQNHFPDKALELSSDMIKSGVELDSVALLTILSAVARLSLLRKGKEIHGYALRRTLHLAGPIASALVNAYASCGALNESFKVFDSTASKDLVLYTSMMNAYGMHGQGMSAIEIFDEMRSHNKKKNEDTQIDHVAFLALLNACSHSGLVEEGRKLFESMRNRYNLEPWPEHYACLVDLLGRTNRLEEALELIQKMEIEPTPTIWSALISACKVHSNMEIAELAAEKLLETDPENPGHYVLVSNLYASAKRWEEVGRVRNLMRVRGLRKDPGCSWIEEGNEVHAFIAGDDSHPRSSEIYEKLGEITDVLERDGWYKPRTECVLRDLDDGEKAKVLRGHSERLAIAYGLISSSKGAVIRVTKNLRVCDDCHDFTKLLSRFTGREIIVRDSNRFHRFRNGVCSCGDFW